MSGSPSWKPSSAPILKLPANSRLPWRICASASRTATANGGDLSARVGYSYQSRVVATTETHRGTTAPLAPFGLPPIS